VADTHIAYPEENVAMVDGYYALPELILVVIAFVIDENIIKSSFHF
jgi:hypothetical protein